MHAFVFFLCTSFASDDSFACVRSQAAIPITRELRAFCMYFCLRQRNLLEMVSYATVRLIFACVLTHAAHALLELGL